MTRAPQERLGDILASCVAITKHLEQLETHEDLVFDAIRIRLVEIGEAVKDLDPMVTAEEPSIPWSEIARMRDLTYTSLLRYSAFNRVHHRSVGYPAIRKRSPQDSHQALTL